MPNTTPSQKAFRLRLPTIGPRWKVQAAEFALNDARGTVPPEKLFCDLLKRLANAAMQDATECEPVTVSAHVARLRDFESIMACLCRHPELLPTGEELPSGYALTHPSTLADYQAAINITRARHRAPAFVNKWASEFQALHDRIDSLAHLIRMASVEGEVEQ